MGRRRGGLAAAEGRRGVGAFHWAGRAPRNPADRDTRGLLSANESRTPIHFRHGGGAPRGSKGSPMPSGQSVEMAKEAAGLPALVVSESPARMPARSTGHRSRSPPRGIPAIPPASGWPPAVPRSRERPKAAPPGFPPRDAADFAPRTDASLAAGEGRGAPPAVGWKWTSSNSPGQGADFPLRRAELPGGMAGAGPRFRRAAALPISGRAPRRISRGWRGQASRQPGQVRKEAAVTSPAWVVVQPLTQFPRGGGTRAPDAPGPRRPSDRFAAPRRRAHGAFPDGSDFGPPSDFATADGGARLRSRIRGQLRGGLARAPRIKSFPAGGRWPAARRPRHRPPFFANRRPCILAFRGDL